MQFRNDSKASEYNKSTIFNRKTRSDQSLKCITKHNKRQDTIKKYINSTIKDRTQYLHKADKINMFKHQYTVKYGQNRGT